MNEKNSFELSLSEIKSMNLSVIILSLSYDGIDGSNVSTINSGTLTKAVLLNSGKVRRVLNKIRNSYPLSISVSISMGDTLFASKVC